MLWRSDHPAPLVEDEVVAAEDQDIGDLDGLFVALHRGGGVGCAGGDFGLFVVFDGGDGVATDEEGAVGLGEEQATEARGDAREGEKIDARGDRIGGGLAFAEDGDLVFEFALCLVVGIARVAEEGRQGDADSLAFVGVDEPFGVVKGSEPPAGVGLEAGEEDMGDVGGVEPCAFVEAGDDGLRRETGIDEDGRVAGAHERGRRVAGADLAAGISEGVLGECAEGNDSGVHREGW